MDSETDVPQASVIERLISSRNRDLAVFLPFVLGITDMTNNTNPDQDSQNPEEFSQEISTPGGSREAARDRFILVNPFTQGMIVIEAGSSGFSSVDSLLRDFFNKDGEAPASEASIEALPSVQICEDNAGGECVICLEDWKIGEVAKEMPCTHKFHGECVEKWLKIHGSCPLCRYKLPAEDGDGNKKGVEDGSRGRRRDIWVSFSFARDGRLSVDTNQTASSESSHP